MKKKELEEFSVFFKDDEISPHLCSQLGAKRYIKMADQIAKKMSTGKILDWGAGAGQMSYLLKNRGFDVISYDVADEARPLLDKVKQPIIIGTHPAALPFPDVSFDAILSSGVLEHVADDQSSLKEIFRILKPGGYFFIYMLPNKYSYIEFISDRLGRGDHPVKYSMDSIKVMLKENGFKVLSTGYQNFLPYNLKGFPKLIQKAYHYFDKIIEPLDLLFTNLFLFRALSTNLIVLACKKN